MYTPGQVSKMLDIPPSTLRRWATRFSGHLSEHANKRRRMYTDQDVLTLSRIKELSAQGILLDDIAPLLEVRDPEAGEIPSALALVPNILETFEELRSTTAQLRSEMDTLREEMDELKSRQERSWWERLFKKHQ